MKTAFLIPVYNHGATLKTVISSLEKYKLPVIVVDDGNDEKNRMLIEETCDFFNKNTASKEGFIRRPESSFSEANTFSKENIASEANTFSNENIASEANTASKKTFSFKIYLLRNEINSGKGASVINGVRYAENLGFTHVFQLDSDGQHDTSYVPDFLEKSEKFPDSVIAGFPEYDATVPKVRLNGRKFANTWIHIVTLSKKIQDAMIGFRIYPVVPFLKAVDSSKIDKRMGFDIEVLVRLSWLGCDIISRPVKISYPMDGISNFRMVQDNVRISWTYTRLCARMLVTWPVILSKRGTFKSSLPKAPETAFPKAPSESSYSKASSEGSYSRQVSESSFSKESSKASSESFPQKAPSESSYSKSEPESTCLESASKSAFSGEKK